MSNPSLFRPRSRTTGYILVWTALAHLVGCTALLTPPEPPTAPDGGTGAPAAPELPGSGNDTDGSGRGAITWEGVEYPLDALGNPKPLPPPPLEELLGDRGLDLDYYRQKGLPAELVIYPVAPLATDPDREAVARMKAGDFLAAARYEWLPIGVPPPWDVNPADSRNWDHFRHAWQWLAPLVKVWIGDGDIDSFALLQAVIRDWAVHADAAADVTLFVWADHTTAHRLRVLSWVWDLFRTSELLEEEFARELLTMIYTHAEFTASGVTYRAYSNHGMEQNIALLEVGITQSEFAAAERWRVTARQRLSQFLADNFSPNGFHLEQSPGYHWYVLARLGNLIRFLRINGEPISTDLQAVTWRAGGLWPYLLRPDNRVANVGDTGVRVMRDHLVDFPSWWGDAVPQPAPSTLPNPRDDAGEFMLDFDAGYAIFTGYALSDPLRSPDTYVLFKCNAFKFAHNHDDALSFILYGLGRDWLVDAGWYSFDDEPERAYVVSSRAHNVVLVDGADFALGNVELVDSGRTEARDFVSTRHHLENATHTRTIALHPPRTVIIHDHLQSIDELTHSYMQVFHADPELSVEIVSDRRAELVAPNGDRCIVEQFGQSGTWTVVVGQESPLQGWHSANFEQFEPAVALIYTSPQATDFEFETRLQLIAAPP